MINIINERKIYCIQEWMEDIIVIKYTQERNLIRTEKKRDTQRQVEENSIKDAKYDKRYKEAGGKAKIFGKRKS